MTAPVPTVDEATAVRLDSAAEPTPPPDVEDLLVEEVSIDGMCGVY